MVVTIGEALIDLIEQENGSFHACLGGSVCNFSLALARQDVPVSYLNPLSIDRFGDQFYSLLVDNGVNLDNTDRSACPTSLAVVSLDAQGSPTYAFHRQGVADRDIDAATLIGKFPQYTSLLHTGGLALVPEDIDKMATVIEAATARGAIISIDANLRPMVVKDRTAYIDGVMRVLKTAHIVKLSDEDLDVLGFPDITAPQLLTHFFEGTAVELIAITRGAQGAFLLTRGHVSTLPAPDNVQVTDTVGAGDCFHAGLIAFLQHAGKLSSVTDLKKLDSPTLQSALQHAICSASLNVMRTGCDPATWKQVEEYRRSLAHPHLHMNTQQ